MIRRKVLALVGVFSLSFSAVAMAASSATYTGSFVASVTSSDAITVTGNDMKVTHTQSNTQGRTVAIEAMRKGTLGYGQEATIKKVSSNVNGVSYTATGLTNGTYKLRFTEKSGNCSNCGYIDVSGSFKD